jgi:hypothetical protein
VVLLLTQLVFLAPDSIIHIETNGSHPNFGAISSDSFMLYERSILGTYRTVFFVFSLLVHGLCPTWLRVGF